MPGNGPTNNEERMDKLTPPKRGRVVKVNAIAYANMVKLMLEGVYTVQELADQTGLHYVTVCQYARELHRVGAAHISAWQPDSRDRDALKIYKIGSGKDKARRRLTASERQRRHREGKKGRIASVFLLGAAPPGV